MGWEEIFEISKDEMTHHIMPLSLHKNLSSCTVAALLHLAGSSTPPSLGTSNRFRSNLQPSLDGNGKGGELGQSTTLVDVGIVLKIMWKRAEESITGIINNWWCPKPCMSWGTVESGVAYLSSNPQHFRNTQCPFLEQHAIVAQHKTVLILVMHKAD